jgi:sulfur-oxidizing protein SoxY
MGARLATLDAGLSSRTFDATSSRNFEIGMDAMTGEATMQTRREFVQSSSLVGALAAIGLLGTEQALAQAQPWNKAAFEAKNLAEVVKALGGSAPAESKDITITAPDIAENGAVVPLGASTTLAGVKQLLILVEKNPNPLVALFNVNENIEPNFLTRAKMSQSSDVYAVALTNDGKTLFAKKEVKVTLGGCGG